MKKHLTFPQKIITIIILIEKEPHKLNVQEWFQFKGRKKQKQKTSKKIHK